MSVDHSFYAVYGVELVEADWAVVDDGLTELRRTRRLGDGREDVQLYTVSREEGPESVVIGVTSKELPPGTCKPVQDFPASSERDQVLRAAAAFLGCRMKAEPGWLIVHDLS
ncbi:hypothetical protein ACFYZ8_33130 [Streptomyces sp. NPDC001668]|uniref:hypothetical protein n=1 Tax=Streptomyces sp. NPDC001668 TaxID=3364598 RepID=UPI0036B361A1